jgi:DNA polymerase-3 subunit gamma/tau
VPVTVLSRCQRFDLRRVERERLSRHLAAIAEREQVALEPGALALIVRAAEGSVRDGLSLLDQAISLIGDGAPITVGQVEDMLGLADRGRVLDLFERVMQGDIKGALDRLAELYDLGTEPLTVIQELLEISHWLTRIKVVPAAAEARDVAADDAARAGAMAQRLSVPVLARTWQMLLKGLDEVQSAPSPLLAAEMLLVRLAYVADLPPPAELAAALKPKRSAAPGPQPATAEVIVARDPPPGPGLAEPPAAPAPTPPSPGSFAEAVELFRLHDQPRLYSWLHDHVRVVHFEPGRIEIAQAAEVPAAWPQEAAQCLSQWTASAWRLRAVEGPGAATLAELAAARQLARIESLAGDPRIKPILEHFPGARIVEVRADDRAS